MHVECGVDVVVNPSSPCFCKEGIPTNRRGIRALSMHIVCFTVHARLTQLACLFIFTFFFGLQLFFVCHPKFAMSSRIKNSADFETYVSVVQKCLLSWDYKYLKPDWEDVAAAYHDFCLELLSKTGRPSKDLLLKAVKKVHTEASDDAVSFVDRMLSVFQQLRLKARTATSLKKVDVKIRDLVSAAKKDMSTLSPSPSPVNIKGGGSSSSKHYEGRAEIFQQYGLSVDVAKSGSKLVEISSDEDAGNCLQANSPTATKLSIDCEWFDAHELAFKRKYSDGSCVIAATTAGPCGFLMALFPGEEEKETDTPNLALLPIAKKPAAAGKKVAKENAKKRPAALISKDSSTSEEDLEENEPESPKVSKPAGSKVFMKYSKPYRYPNGAYAIRRMAKDDKKQVAQIFSATMDETEVYNIILEASNLLSSGDLIEQEIKQWLQDRIS